MARVNPRQTARLQAPVLLADLLLYRLSRLLATGGHPVIRLCEGRYGITRREWRVLSLLAEQPGVLSSSQLAQLAQLDRARTSRAITSLAAKGLLRREAGPADRRQVRLSLTAAGQALHDELFPQVASVNRELLAVLDEQEAAALQQALERLQARADELLGSAAALPKADRRRGRTARRAPG